MSFLKTVFATVTSLIGICYAGQNIFTQFVVYIVIFPFIHLFNRIKFTQRMSKIYISMEDTTLSS